MRETVSADDVRRAVEEAGPNAWFRPMRILNDEFRHYGVLQHKFAGTLGALLDLHGRGFLVNDGSDHGIDLIGGNGSDLYDTLPLSREGMRFLRSNWRLHIERPRRYPWLTTPSPEAASRDEHE